jgi:hypothetical protein
MLIVYCPLCPGNPAQPILTEYTVAVKSGSENRLGGLCVYQCPDGHVFFVREADLHFVSATAAA